MTRDARSSPGSVAEALGGEVPGLLDLATQAMGFCVMLWETESDDTAWIGSPASILGPAGADGGYPPFDGMVHAEDRAYWQDMRDSAAQSGTRRYEFRLIRTDGVECWVRAYEIVLPATGTGRRVLVVLEDVTAEKNLRTVEERYVSLVQLSSDWYWKQDENFRFVVLSGAEEGPRLPSLPYGKTRWELPAPEGADTQWNEHRAKLEAHEPFRDFEYQVLNRDGKAAWVSASGLPIFDEQRRFRGYSGYARDITELKEAQRKTAQAQLDANQAQRQLLQAIDGVADGFVIYDAADRLVLCNQRYREIFRTSADLLVPGARFEDIVREGVRRGQYPEAAADPERWIASRLAAHGNANQMSEVLTDDGRWVRVDEHRSANGDVVGFRADITELKNAILRAEAANAAKSNFLTIMSHEMRTPLTMIIGFAEIALESAADPRLKKDIEEILTSAQRLLILVNDVLDLSRILAGKLRLEEVDFDLRTSLETLARSFEPACLAKSVVLRLEADLEPPSRVYGPQHALEQVVTNLLSNAVKVTAEGEVVLRAALRRSGTGTAEIEVTVQDTGSGIAAEQFPHLFDPFIQADATITRQYGGTGLGLAISKRLVSLMGGVLSFESESGEGSTFRFSVRFSTTPPATGETLPLVSSL